MRRACMILVFLASVLAVPTRAGDFRFSTSFTPKDFEDLSEAVADAVVFPNLGPASPSGIAGFEIMGAAGGPKVDTGAHWWREGIDGKTTGGVVPGVRGIARKGLPGNLDVGAQAGKVLGVSFWGVEGRWAFMEGGVVSPAIALRASYSRLSGSPVGLEVGEAQLVLSKGFVVFTPYAAMGARRIKTSAKFGDPIATEHTFSANRATAAAGVRMTIFPLHIVAEVRQGSRLGYFIGVGAGL